MRSGVQDIREEDIRDEDCDCSEVEIPAGAAYAEFQIINKKGLHARATAKFVQCASQFDADITVSRCGETVGATSIMGILTLGAGIGSTITVVAKGAESKEALQALGALVADRFGEGE
jgi:phosphocarrier protein HPr